MTRQIPTRIVWFRQDLRTADNPALHAAARDGARILPIYILVPFGHWGLGGASSWWLHHSLAALSRSLAELGAPLCLRRGHPAEILPDLMRALNATEIHAGICAEPNWREADREIAAALEGTSCQLVLHQSGGLTNPDTIRTRTGGIYGMYTPFARAARAMGDPPKPLPAPEALKGARVAGDALGEWKLLPTHPDWATGLRATWKPGEAAAISRMRSFLNSAIEDYGTGRNLPGQDLTSMLSPHLHWGEISAATVWHALRCLKDGEGVSTYGGELIWRDFASYLLWHKPTLPDAPLRPEFARLPWRRDKRALQAWQLGRTGVPIVDAGMRQLWETGWMHNRVRMITASFLVKHLLIDWREGAAWFWDTLVDADLANNSTNWQWVAGTGIDSQPFFRVFNPVSQGEKFDGEGGYVRRYVPELAKLPDRFLHAPWMAPDDVLERVGVVLGRTYPRPIVDLAAGRARALESYRAAVARRAA